METYKKRMGLFADPAVRNEIGRLDEHNDSQRIAHLLAAYEFPWEFTRALEVALYYTYASDSVSRLLERTAEFEKHGQKRYDDTAILIGLFIESGWDGEFGRKAIERINKTHGHYAIPNDDFLFVLWTFVEFPIWWTDNFGRRRMTKHEKRAWFNFWVEVGARMGIQSIPGTKDAYDAFIREYEATHFVYTDANRRVSDATLRIMQSWFPAFMGPMVKIAVRGLMPANFLRAVGYDSPPSWLRASATGTLKLVGMFLRVFAVGNYPRLVKNRKDRTYTHGYKVEEIQPVHLSRRNAAEVSANRAD